MNVAGAAEPQGKAAPPKAAPSTSTPAAGPSVFSQMAPDQLAGRMFGEPVPVANYYFAKRVSYTFPRPWEEDASPADRERFIWEALVLHFESFRRGIMVTDEELEKRIASVLKAQQQTFTRAGDPAAYAAWVKTTLDEDVELFENQMRYLYQIDKLKEQMRASFSVPVTEEEMQQEFLNEQHHVGGEMVAFDTKDAAEAFYRTVKDPNAWEAMKAGGGQKVRPVSLMTVEAYVDLWSIPKAQMDAFHALPLGAVGEPMPFGKQWCVYRLLEKRTGNLADFPAQREAYLKQLTVKKQYEALKQWIEQLKASARLEVYPIPQ